MVRQLTEDLFLAESPATELGPSRQDSLVGLLALAHAAADSRCLLRPPRHASL